MNILSRYRLRYPVVIAYMLQASEYNIREYLSWLHRTRDFGAVEKRKKFVPTPKSLGVVALLWLLFILWCLIFFILWPPLVLAGIVSAPFVLAYAIIAPLWILQMVLQKPIEAYIIYRAKNMLKRSTAVKIAIAGSYGKTSFKENLRTVLSLARNVKATPGNWNTPIGIARFVKSLQGNEDILLFEFGEYYPGDIKRLAALVRPDLGVVTGVNEAHLEKFKTLKRSADTIFELAAFVPKEKLYINGESPLAAARAVAGNITYGVHGAGSWTISDAHTTLEGTTAVLTEGDERMQLRSKLLGLHQLGPLAACASIASELGLTGKEIESGLAATAPFEHRLEPRQEAEGVVFIDDTYNANPDGVRAGIDFLRSLEGRRRIYITPGLVEAGAMVKEAHMNIGRQLVGAAEVVVLLKNSVTQHIAEGLSETKFTGRLLWRDDVAGVFTLLKGIQLPGDVILMQNDWPDNYA